MEWKSVDDILDFAIATEQEAHDFYLDLSEKVATMKETFAGFAKEELGHKAKLEGIKAGKKLVASDTKIMDLKLADYLVDVEAKENMDYQDALILAMKREKSAFKFYNDIAAAVTEKDVKESFLALAQEEAKHKLRFELEYDTVITKEN